LPFPSPATSVSVPTLFHPVLPQFLPCCPAYLPILPHAYSSALISFAFHHPCVVIDFLFISCPHSPRPTCLFISLATSFSSSSHLFPNIPCYSLPPSPLGVRFAQNPGNLMSTHQ
jgi:hypothetical protein